MGHGEDGGKGRAGTNLVSNKCSISPSLSHPSRYSTNGSLLKMCVAYVCSGHTRPGSSNATNDSLKLCSWSWPPGEEGEDHDEEGGKPRSCDTGR